MSNSKTFRHRAASMFGLDLRSLALFRAALALLAMSDLAARATDLTAHYSDLGVLPRRLLFEGILGSTSHFSLHLFSGLPAFAALLFAVAFVAALMLFFGWRTRMATFSLWLLTISLQSRAPVILQGGDAVFRLLLFWSIFLPLGACWSFDSALDDGGRHKPRQVLSAGTVAYYVQIALIYWMNAANKNAPEWRVDATAVYYALSVDQFATPLGRMLLEMPQAFLRFLTRAVVWCEAFGPFLLVSPVYTQSVRSVAVVFFVALQVCFGLTLDLGIFPWSASIAMLPFIPASVWEKAFSALSSPRRVATIYYDGECGFCRKSVLILRNFLLLPGAQVIPAQEVPSVLADMKKHDSWVFRDGQGKRHFRSAAMAALFRASPLARPFARLIEWKPVAAAADRVYACIAGNRSTAAVFLRPFGYAPLRWELSAPLQVLAVLSLTLVIGWNIAGFRVPDSRMPERAADVVRVLRLDQHWTMFAPYPIREDGWYVMPGRLADRTTVDVFRSGAPVSFEKPADVPRAFRNDRWRKYLQEFWKRSNASMRPEYASWVCREWNRSHSAEKRLKSLEVDFMLEETPPPGQKPSAHKVKLGEWPCP